MSVLEKKSTSTHNSKKRFLEVELNGAGIIVGLDAYSRLKGQPDYIGDVKEVFPPMEVFSGTLGAGTGTEKKEFTVSGSTNPPTFEKGMAAVLFKKSDLESLKNQKDFAKLANPNLVETIVITAIETKKITLERAPLNSAFTEVIILRNEGFIKVAQLVNFDAEEAQDKIDTDTQTSGDYKSEMGGKKSSGVTGIKGLYDPLIPSCQTLETAYNTEQTVRARHGAMKEKYAGYTIGTYKVTQFSTIGEVSGNGRLEYSVTLNLQDGRIEKGNFI